jgi:hypothetical protein
MSGDRNKHRDTPLTPLASALLPLLPPGVKVRRLMHVIFTILPFAVCKLYFESSAEGGSYESLRVRVGIRGMVLE